jgi:hypothetical protein
MTRLRGWYNFHSLFWYIFALPVTPSPQIYVEWLRSNLNHRQKIPYVLDAAARKNARPIEGPTHVDAMFMNMTNGFAWLIEAKVLSDVSYLISFDNFRNQIARTST